jgi:hypothetical protein
VKGLENTTYLISYIISNTVALLMLLAAWKSPKLARVMFFLLFAWASGANWRAALHTPQFYIDYADLSFSDAYNSLFSVGSAIILLKSSVLLLHARH